MNPMDLFTQFQASHPIYSHLAALIFGGFVGPQLLAWFESKGIPKAIKWFDDHQEKLLERAGLTPEQIKAVRMREVLDLRKAADALEAENQEPSENKGA